MTTGLPRARACERERPSGDERGVATVLMAALCGVVLILLVGTATLLAAVQASHRARAAADFAALAAAGALLDPAQPRAPCALAADYAGRNGARVLRCVASGDTVLVTVAVAGDWPGLGTAVARARAGPAHTGPH